MSVCYGGLLFALRQQVSTVVAIVTEATVAVGAMPSLLPFPLLPLAALLAVYRFGSDPNPNPNPEPNPNPNPNPNPDQERWRGRVSSCRARRPHRARGTWRWCSLTGCAW